MAKKNTHFLSLDSMKPKDIMELIDTAADMKENREVGITEQPLKNRILGLIFEKPSLRTRVSFEVAMAELGGQSIYLAPGDVGLGKREVIRDVAEVLSRLVHGIVIRTFAHEKLFEFAKYSKVPVINALSDFMHPCQILGDLLTIQEKFGTLKGLQVCYIGDGNNVCNSWMEVAPLVKIKLHIACPEGYLPSAEVYKTALKRKGYIKMFRNPMEAAKGCDVLYTDVWASMGQESEAEARRAIFRNYQINSQLLSLAKPTAIAMHCLPAHYGEEITEEVAYGPQSVIFPQAENRMHTQKALLALLL